MIMYPPTHHPPTPESTVIELQYNNQQYPA
jgi:hypothetical protein